MVRSAGHLLAWAAILVAACVIVVADTAGNSWGSGTTLMILAAWPLTALGPLAGAPAAGVGGSPRAGLLLAAAAGWAPAVAGRSWVPAVLDLPLLAATLILPAALLVHAGLWAGGRLAWTGTVTGLCLVAAAITVVFYSPGTDPLCTARCGAATSPWGDLVPSRPIVVTVALLTLAASVLALASVCRAGHAIAWPVRLGVVLGLVAAGLLPLARMGHWGLSAGPAERVVWYVLPLGLAAGGTVAHQLVLRSTRRRLARLATRLAEMGGKAGSQPQVQFAVDEGWVDADGTPVTGQTDTLRALLVTDGTGRPWVRVLDASPRQQFQGPAGWDAVDWLRLENARQTALLRADEREVTESRQRIVARSDAERRRIEHDLHDGAQQALIAAKLHLAIAWPALPSETTDTVRAVEESTQRALTALRDLTHRVYARSLESGGLTTALHDLAQRRPMTLRFDGPVDDLPPLARSTAYEVVRRVAGRLRPASEIRVIVVAHPAEVEVVVRLTGGAPDDAEVAVEQVEDRVGAVGGSVGVVRGDDMLSLRAVIPCVW